VFANTTPQNDLAPIFTGPSPFTAGPQPTGVAAG
jgi:hypothetical protein